MPAGWQGASQRVTDPPRLHTFPTMQRVFRSLSLAVAVVGGGLWFFGGMNTGPSQWMEDGAVMEHALGVATKSRAVFRPGLSFLGGSVVASLVLFCASWATRPSAGKDMTGPGS